MSKPISKIKYIRDLLVKKDISCEELTQKYIDEIEKNNEYAAKRLNISNDIIKYDLIKTEKDKLKQVEGE